MTAIVQKIKLINADAQNNRISAQDAAEALDALSSKLNTMKRKVCYHLFRKACTYSNRRKLEKYWQEERLHAKQLRARVNHLASIANVTSVRAPEFQRWSHERLNRVIVDYLLREGLTETAKRVAAANGVEVN